MSFCFSKLTIFLYRLPDHIEVRWPDQNPCKQNDVLSAGTVLGKTLNLNMVMSSNTLSHYYKLKTVFTLTLLQDHCKLKFEIRDKSHYPGFQQQAREM